MAKTLFEKVWERHVVLEDDGEPALLYVDLHLVHEVTSPQAFEGLRLAGRKVRRPDLTVATMDHNVPTLPGPITDPMARAQLDALRANCEEFGIRLYGTGSGHEGIVHVIGPELGLTQPGMTIVCGDSHTSTHGAFGALAFGIGTSEVEHVLATQTLYQQRPRTMLLELVGELPAGLTAKDIILGTIGQVGVDGGVGYVVEYAGEAIAALSMESRMTVCNMSIEWGARAGMIAPDETTFAYLEGRDHAPQGADWERAARGLALATERSGRRVRHAQGHRRRGARAAGHLGHEPRHGRPGHGGRSRPGLVRRPGRPRSPPSARSRTWTCAAGSASRTSASTASSSARARTRGSRTCGRPPGSSRATASTRTVKALVVPGSATVRRQAEAEGLDRGVPRRRFRVAPRGLLDVPRHEPGHPRARASGAPRRRTGTSRAGRAAAGARTSSARRWPPRRRSTATSSTSASSTASRYRREAVPRGDRSRRRARPPRRRHRPDHPEAVPQADRAHRVRRVPLLRLAPRRGRRRTARLRAQPAGVPRRARSCSPAATSAAARRASTPPWALQDYGFDVVVAPSFGDIFRTNAGKIGMLAIALPADEVKRLMESVDLDTGSEVTVDLERRVIVAPDGREVPVRVRRDHAPPAPRRARRHRPHAAARGRDRSLRDGARHRVTPRRRPPRRRDRARGDAPRPPGCSTRSGSSTRSTPSAATRSSRRARRFPDETLAACREADAVLLGAVGLPELEGQPVRPEQGLLGLRQRARRLREPPARSRRGNRPPDRPRARRRPLLRREGHARRRHLVRHLRVHEARGGADRPTRPSRSPASAAGG